MEFPWDIEVSNTSGRGNRDITYHLKVDFVFDGIEKAQLDDFIKEIDQDGDTQFEDRKYDSETKRLVLTATVLRGLNEDIIDALEEEIRAIAYSVHAKAATITEIKESVRPSFEETRRGVLVAEPQ